MDFRLSISVLLVFEKIVSFYTDLHETDTWYVSKHFYWPKAATFISFNKPWGCHWSPWRRLIASIQTWGWHWSPWRRLLASIITTLRLTLESLETSNGIKTDLRLTLESLETSNGIKTDLRLTLESLETSNSINTDLRLTLESLKKSANICTDLRLATEVSVDVCKHHYRSEVEEVSKHLHWPKAATAVSEESVNYVYILEAVIGVSREACKHFFTSWAETDVSVGLSADLRLTLKSLKKP